ncbi:hypothetical protein CICLE_v10013324mg, partial [Citrus x clementina]
KLTAEVRFSKERIWAQQIATWKLPLDVIIDKLIRLPVKSLLRFKDMSGCMVILEGFGYDVCSDDYKFVKLLVFNKPAVKYIEVAVL